MIVIFQRGEFELPSVQHAKERKVNVEIRFSVGKVYAGNDVRNLLGTGLGTTR